MRHFARVDANQAAIVRLLRQLGCSVVCTHTVGAGFADLVCARGGINVLVEVKDGSAPPAARRLTPDEQAFRDTWQGRYVVVETAEDAIALVDSLRHPE